RPSALPPYSCALAFYQRNLCAPLTRAASAACIPMLFFLPSHRRIKKSALSPYSRQSGQSAQEIVLHQRPPFPSLLRRASLEGRLAGRECRRPQSLCCTASASSCRLPWISSSVSVPGSCIRTLHI